MGHEYQQSESVTEAAGRSGSALPEADETTTVRIFSEDRRTLRHVAADIDGSLADAVRYVLRRR